MNRWCYRAGSVVVCVMLLVATCARLCAAGAGLQEFKKKAQQIQGLSDEKGEHAQALKRYLQLRDDIGGYDIDEKYVAGLEVSIAYAARAAENEEVMKKQAGLLLAQPSRQFAAMEYFVRKGNITYVYWKTGETHAEVHDIFVIPKRLEKAKSELEKAKIFMEEALWWSGRDYGREESSWGMSYGDMYVERIYFNKQLDEKDKLRILEELHPKLKGSARANVCFCLALMCEKDGRTAAAIEYLSEAAKIFKKLGDAKSFHRNMLGRCEKKLEKLKQVP